MKKRNVCRCYAAQTNKQIKISTVAMLPKQRLYMHYVFFL